MLSSVGHKRCFALLVANGNVSGAFLPHAARRSTSSRIHSPMFTPSSHTQRKVAVSRHYATRFSGMPDQTRYSSSYRQSHLGIVIVPQGENWVIERLGKFLKVLDSGFHFLIPLIDVIAYKHSIKELAFEISKQTAITKDNVQIHIDGVVYARVHDPVKASYEVDRPFFALTTLAQTTMRSEIGKISLDTTFAERQNLNNVIVEGIEKVAQAWGISIRRYEIKDIAVPEQIKFAMDLEAEAERKKRKVILESIGERDAQENIALGKKRATELVSEANMTEEINLAKGEAFSIEQKAKAYATAINALTDAINREGGERAVSFKVAEKYIESFAEMARRGNTIIIPANVNDAAGMVTQAVTIFDKVFNSKGKSDSLLPNLSKEQALDEAIALLERHDTIGDGTSNLELRQMLEKLRQRKKEISVHKQPEKLIETGSTTTPTYKA